MREWTDSHIMYFKVPQSHSTKKKAGMIQKESAQAVFFLGTAVHLNWKTGPRRDENDFFSFLFFFFFFLFRVTCVPYRSSQAGVKWELQLLDYTTATATWDPTHLYNLPYRSWQRQILNPLARSGIKPTSSWILVRFITVGPQQEFRKWLDC